MADIKNFVEYRGGMQRDVREVTEFFSEYVKENKVDKVLILFSDEEDDQMFVCGNNARDYSMMEINWDIDCLKSYLFYAADNDECEE